MASRLALFLSHSISVELCRLFAEGGARLLERCDPDSNDIEERRKQSHNSRTTRALRNCKLVEIGHKKKGPEKKESTLSGSDHKSSDTWCSSVGPQRDIHGTSFTGVYKDQSMKFIFRHFDSMASQNERNVTVPALL